MIVYTDLLCRSPGYGLTLVSESTEGMMHAANGSSHSKQFSVSTSGVAPPTPMLPEDIGRQTTLLLIEEIVRVSQGRRHQLIDFLSAKTDDDEQWEGHDLLYLIINDIVRAMTLFYKKL